MPELIPAAPGSPEWLAARRLGVTATDIVTLLGLSTWNSPYSLYWQKMGQVPETPDNDRFRLGRELEPYVTSRWVQEDDNWKDFVRWGGGLYRHSDRAWQMATPDQVLGPPNWLTGDPVTPVAVLEVKTWADADKPAWQDGPPAAVRAQVLWQMDVMDVATGHVGVVFLPSGEFRSYTLSHDDHSLLTVTGRKACSVCADLAIMRTAGEEFMARLRLELPAPDPDASAATLAAVKARFARQPDKTAEVDPVPYWDWVNAKLQLAAVEEKIRNAEIKLREQAGEATVLTIEAEPVARRITGDAQVKAHTRHSDYLKRIKTEDDSE